MDRPESVSRLQIRSFYKAEANESSSWWNWLWNGNRQLFSSGGSRKSLGSYSLMHVGIAYLGLYGGVVEGDPCRPSKIGPHPLSLPLSISKFGIDAQVAYVPDVIEQIVVTWMEKPDTLPQDACVGLSDRVPVYRRFDPCGAPLDVCGVKWPKKLTCPRSLGVITCHQKVGAYSMAATKNGFTAVWIVGDVLWARRFFANNTPPSSAFQVNEIKSGVSVIAPRIIGTDTGFLIVWAYNDATHKELTGRWYQYQGDTGHAPGPSPAQFAISSTPDEISTYMGVAVAATTNLKEVAVIWGRAPNSNGLTTDINYKVYPSLGIYGKGFSQNLNGPAYANGNFILPRAGHINYVSKLASMMSYCPRNSDPCAWVGHRLDLVTTQANDVIYPKLNNIGAHLDVIGFDDGYLYAWLEGPPNAVELKAEHRDGTGGKQGEWTVANTGLKLKDTIPRLANVAGGKGFAVVWSETSVEGQLILSEEGETECFLNKSESQENSTDKE